MPVPQTLTAKMPVPQTLTGFLWGVGPAHQKPIDSTIQDVS
ncbi:hypothetical protein [Microcoleus sp. LEGE 07076]|nr:hypothetical protein [Microcoleus sp. LEGE 07076]